MSPQPSLALLLGAATATTIACSLAAYFVGYATGRQSKKSSNNEPTKTNDSREDGILTEMYLQRRHRRRLSFTSDDDDYEDEVASDNETASSAGRGGLYANNWHHFEGYQYNGKQQQVDNAAARVPRHERPLPPLPAGARLGRRTGNPIPAAAMVNDHAFLVRRKTSALSDDEEDITQPLEGEDRRRHSESSDNCEVPRIFRNDTEPTANLSRSVCHSDNDVGTSLPRRLPRRVSFPRSHRKARTEYNARIMPHRLILIRHGQSRGNIDEALYATTPDNAMNLTELGWNQAKAAGEHLKSNICKNWESEGIHFIVSPYVRTVETFHGILSAWVDPAEISGEDRLEKWYSQLAKLGLEWHEDPRLREQDFGNFQDPQVIKQAKQDRHRFGAFYYRFPHGESASDVFDRTSTFLDSLWRSFDVNDCRNYVLITHGISIRVILARYFRYTIDQFHMMANPRNCEIVTMRHDGRGKLVLSGRHDLHFNHDKDDGDPDRITGYKSHKRLRCLPPNSIRKTSVRLSFDR